MGKEENKSTPPDPSALETLRKDLAALHAREEGKNKPWGKEEVIRGAASHFIALPSYGIVAFGQHIQDYPLDYSQFLRWHLTDMFDLPCWGAAFDCARIATTGHSKPKRSAAIVLSIGIGHKFYQANLPNRSFDYVDATCFVGGAIAYVAAHKWVTKGIKKIMEFTPK